MPLSPPQYQTAVTLLTPHFNGSSEHRKAIASLPLHGLAVMTKIQWDMTGAAAFTAHLVSALELFDDKVSVCNLLRHIAESVGEPSQSRMTDLIREIEGVVTPSEPTAVPPASTVEPTLSDAPHAFISYSRKDTAFVERLEAELKRHRITVWRDTTSIPGGEDWYQNIINGLTHAYAMICVVTAHAEQSKWVKREQLRADDLGIPPIAVHPAKYANPLHLQEVQPILMDDASFAVGLKQVIAALDSCKAKYRSIAPVAVAAVPETHDDNAAVQEYLRWVLTDAKADLRDSLYVDLEAAPERAPKPRETSALSRDLDDDDDFVFSSVQLERLAHDDFAKAGEDLPEARQAIREMRRAVLLGDPGAGKTTTLLKFTVDLARAAQADPDAKLPLFVPLREFDGTMPFGDFVRLKGHNLQAEFEGLRDRFVLLCDALNEMPRNAADGRDLVAEVRHALSGWPDWVVSCRVRDYTDDLSGIGGIGKIRLKPLDLPRIHEFVTRKFAGWARPDRGADLWRELRGSDDLLKAWAAFVTANAADAFWGNVWLPENPYSWSEEGRAWSAMHADHRRLMVLCRNPFMANMVCRLYKQSTALPNNRAGLFRDFVTRLLGAEAERLSAIGVKWIGDEPIRLGMAQVAWALGAQTEMPRADAETIVRRHVTGHDPAVVLGAAASAQLIEYGSSVRFTHQLLQQYFAASVLGMMMDDKADPASIWTQDTWWESTGREETAILLAGDRNDPHGVARWLAPAQPHVALELLSQPDFALNMSALEPATRTILVGAANAKRDTADPHGRAAAYRVLGKLKADDRGGVGLNADDLPDIDWVTIPAGEFIYQQAQKITLRAFEIARYPITYAQFQTFIDDAAGFSDPRWWDGLADHVYRRQNQSAPGEQWFKFWNHPRERVSWYDAMAFCRWFSWRLGGSYDLDKITAWAVRLPTEYEWEKAARGKHGLNYPYGNDFDATKGNTQETGIGQTSAVGIFPDGASPDGLLDMSGNVFQWCLTDYEKPDLDAGKENLGSAARRVLRGGSWYYDPDSARAACRLDRSPSVRSVNFGFRLVRPPSL